MQPEKQPINKTKVKSGGVEVVAIAILNSERLLPHLRSS